MDYVTPIIKHIRCFNEHELRVVLMALTLKSDLLTVSAMDIYKLVTAIADSKAELERGAE